MILIQFWRRPPPLRSCTVSLQQHCSQSRQLLPSSSCSHPLAAAAAAAAAACPRQDGNGRVCIFGGEANVRFRSNNLVGKFTDALLVCIGVHAVFVRGRLWCIIVQYNERRSIGTVVVR